MGIGSVPLLRNSFNVSIDEALLQQARSTLVSQLFDAQATPDSIVFAPKAEPITTAYFVAIYDNDRAGTMLISGGGTASSAPAPPVFPETFRLSEAQERSGKTFDTPSSGNGPSFRYTVTIVQIAGTSKFFTQLVAISTGNVERYTASYLAIFGILASIAIIGGAFLTRWVVTLAFRRLSQVGSTAMAIAAGDFSQRLSEVEPQTTEVGRLKAAINTMLGRLDAAIAQRDASVKQMRRFVGDASHELRTPLVAVRGYAELYRIGAISNAADTAQAMERIEKEAIRMSALVEDLLALARLDERQTIAITDVDLRPIARDAALDVRASEPNRPVTVIDTTTDAPPIVPELSTTTAPTTQAVKARRSAAASARTSGLNLLRRRPRPGADSADEPGAALEQAAPRRMAAKPAAVATGHDAHQPTSPAALTTAVEGPAPVVRGEENRIRQVVTNLLGNARRFTPENSPIDIGIGVDAVKNMGWIAIVDHGDGIPEQIREQIFQRFWRADTSRARETGGSGLGLSIVASIVESLRGTVIVSETPGGGATFRVSFPLAIREPQAADALRATVPLRRVEGIDTVEG